MPPHNYTMTWFFYALGAAIIWGINYAVSGRLLSRGMSPQTLYFLDTVCGGVILALLLTVTGRWEITAQEIRNARPDLIYLVVVVIATLSAGMLIFLSIQAKNATLASLIEITYPLFTAFFVWVLFRQVTFNLTTLFGALLIFAGVIIVAQANR